MDVTKPNGTFPVLPNATKTQNRESKNQGESNFIDTMKSFLSDANTLQKNAADQVEALVSGETTDVHDVMVAMEKASVSFEMVMEIRNRMLEAYQEIMRTQV
ncbi:MAG: flagellar hook-basal body complex protein FliE [Deferribacteres bacterium]|nr:flagellar hook-basal body complex protein FliE [candidate division KSB1 bacterium]MCB9501920.1 flagellar hook-basal body complex protein FliE [Deferribacteres bacterium]